VTLGAILLTVIPDIITFFRLPSTLTGALAQVIYAAALLIILRFRPRGILPERRWIAFDRRVRSRLGDLQTEAE
jgi:ABC-type branched-subunit amino acid transport system permease subunit